MRFGKRFHLRLVAGEMFVLAAAAVLLFPSPFIHTGTAFPMIARKGIHIIFVGLCHLLLALSALTIGLRAETVPPPAADAAPPVVQSGEAVTIQAQQQEKIGSVYYLRGDVEIKFRTYLLRAGEVTYDSDSGDITASGNVVLEGGPHDEHLSASHGNYNIDTDIGRFYDVVGTTGVKLRGFGMVLTSSTPFSFTGAVVEKLGRDKIVVHHGSVTSCALPKPKWSFHAREVTVVAGEDAKIFHGTFWLWRTPVFYFPFVDHPVERLARKSGFLMPFYGHSSAKGHTLGEAFYWNINRSTDATLGAEYFSKRGWAQRGEFRKVFSNSAYLTAHYFGVVDRGTPATVQHVDPVTGAVTLIPGNQDQGGQEVRLTSSTLLRANTRAVADIDYLSSYLFRAAFSETYTAISSEVRSNVFVSDLWRGYFLNVMSSRYQNFQSVAHGDVITILHGPGLEAASVDRQVGGSPFYWAFNSAAEGLSRREPGFAHSAVVGRMDLYPRLSLPLLWRGWTLRPELALRETWYSDRCVSGPVLCQPLGAEVNRRALEGRVELRPPALSRVFERSFFGQQLKHVLEPRIAYHAVTGVSNFRDIRLFDERDIFSNTSEVEYALVNRLYAKNVKGVNCPAAGMSVPAAGGARGSSAVLERPEISAGQNERRPVSAAWSPAAECGPAAREVISWEVAQKYFFDPNFGGALLPGRRNVFTTTEELTGIAFLTQPRHLSPIISRLRMRGPNTDVEWHLDYDTRQGGINSSAAFVNYRFLGNYTLGTGQFFLRSPGEVLAGTAASPAVITAPSKFNQFRILAAYGKPAKPGFAAATTVGFDEVEHTLQYFAAQSNYNWDCCGITFEYRRYKLGIRDENVFRFALSLTNVGTFGTLRKPERLY
jgi:LPS-assembly protein